jgi:hypothetical protein
MIKVEKQKEWFNKLRRFKKSKGRLEDVGCPFSILKFNETRTKRSKERKIKQLRIGVV